jgi:DNA-binding NarL/FixJ family response regulator
MLPAPHFRIDDGAWVRLKPVSSLSPEAQNMLTAADRALIRLVAQGIPDRVMAQRLGITEDQVRSSLVNIFRKLALAGLLDQLLYNDSETQQIAC